MVKLIKTKTIIKITTIIRIRIARYARNLKPLHGYLLNFPLFFHVKTFHCSIYSRVFLESLIIKIIKNNKIPKKLFFF